MNDNSGWFTEDGNIRDDLNVHDKDIPCFIRLGFIYQYSSPCDGCMYWGACHEYATDEKMELIMNDYPKMFNGEIQTRKDYVSYIRQGGG